MSTRSAICSSLVIFDRGEEIARWAATKIDGLTDFGPCEAIGYERDGRLIAGVVYHQFFEGRSINMSVSAEPGSAWATRPFLHQAFRYPFVQIGVGKVHAWVSEVNSPSLALARRLGFQDEGRLRRAWADNQDMIILGMLREECAWLRE